MRWQRRNKLLVPRTGAGADEVAAVIGPRDAALKAVLKMPVSPAPAGHEVTGPGGAPVLAAPIVAEVPVEQTLTVPVAEAPLPQASPEGLAPEPEPVVEEAPVVEPVEVPEVAAETPAPEVVETPAPQEIAEPEVAVAPAEETVEAAAPAVVDAPEPAPTPEAPAADSPAAAPAATATMVVPAAPAPKAVARPEVDLSRMVVWQVLVLSGPAGSGKSSIAQQFCEILPKAAHIKVEPLRDRAYSVLVAQPSNREGVEDGAKAEVWTGKTEEARQQAIDLAAAYSHMGYHVIIDDVIESPPELAFYQAGLIDLTVRTVTLMPSLEELERRDRVLPPEQQAGAKIKELHGSMIRQLSAGSTVLDTSNETVQETVQRILGLLEQ